MDAHTIALLALLLSVKHTLCDLALQKLSYSDKSIYLGRQAHTHYLHHGLGSLLVGFLIDWQFAMLIGVVDYILHWHIDHAKTLVRKRLKYTDKDYEFWLLQTLDQTLHFATYYVFLLVAIRWI